MNNVIYLAGRDQPAAILLVESDPLVRIAVAAHLRKAGLSVVEAIHGAEALRLLRAGRSLSLVLGELEALVNGADLIAMLQREFPDVKLLAGCARDMPPVSRDGVMAIGRPYDLQEVEQAVKILLGSVYRAN